MNFRHLSSCDAIEMASKSLIIFYHRRFFKKIEHSVEFLENDCPDGRSLAMFPK